MKIICLPAFKVAIPSFFETWGIPYGEQIANSLDIIAVLLGTLIGASCATYKADPQEASLADLKKAFDVEDGDHQAVADNDTDKG